MRLYRTVTKAAEAETEIERSRFIAHIRPVETREEAEEFFAEIRKKYRDATHNVPALVLGDKFQVQWASDDGEPQGTSGAPMVQMLVNEEITNVAVIVTRYFGGIKLGTGGLVRAYTLALKNVLDESGISDIREVNVIRAKFDYSCLAKLQNLESKGEFSIADIQYEDMVVLSILSEPEKKDDVHMRLNDISSGKHEILSEEIYLRKV